MSTRIQYRRNTAAAAAASNPVLAVGEPGMETDTGKTKLGDGVTAWNSLPYDAPNEAKLIATFVASADGVDFTWDGNPVSLGSGGSPRPWTGKTVYLYGDSISSTDYSTYGTTLATKTGASVTVGGHSGASTTALTSTTWLDTAIATAPDLVIIMLGGNDAGVAGTVGTFVGVSGETVKTDPDPAAAYAGTTYLEAAAFIVRYLNSKRYLAGMKLVFLNGLPQNRSNHDITAAMNNPLNHRRKADAIREVCDRYHVPMIDTMQLCGWDCAVEPFWPGVTDKVTNYGTYSMDGLHPNPAGYGRLTDAISGFMNGSIKPLTVIVAAPPQVAGLTAGAATMTTVPLSWAAAARATSYLVEKQLGAGAWSAVGTVGGTTTTATGLTAASTYTFRVSAINSGGTGPVSATVSATTPATPTAPGQVTGLATGTMTETTAPLTWTATSGATSYLVESKTAAGSTWTPVTVGTNSATVTGLTAATSYNFRVSAINANGTGTASVTATASTVTPFVTITDDFNRADSTTTLGTTNTGQTWEALTAGSVFGIVSNQAYRQTYAGTGENAVVVDAGKADVDISITTSKLGAGGGIVFRATNSANFWCIDTNMATGHKLFKFVSNAFVFVGLAGNPSAAVGDVARVVAVGSSISVTVNGGTAYTVTDTFNQTATKHGFRIASTVNPAAGRFDDFSIA